MDAHKLYWTMSKLANEAQQSGDIFRFEELAHEATESDLYGLYSEDESWEPVTGSM